MKEQVFISYAKEDKAAALRLYDDLKSHQVNAWIDVENILPGQHKKLAIQNAMKASSHFIALFSQDSMLQRGNHQVQLKKAKDIQDEFPEEDIFFVPVRLNDCDLENSSIHKYQCVDLFPIWAKGLERILKSITSKLVNISDQKIAEDEFMVYELAFLWHDKEPPSIQEHWNLMTPHIMFTKQFLHNAIETGQLKITRELRFVDGVTRFVSKAELKRFAYEIGDVPNFLK